MKKQFLLICVFILSSLGQAFSQTFYLNVAGFLYQNGSTVTLPCGTNNVLIFSQLTAPTGSSLMQLLNTQTIGHWFPPIAQPAERFDHPFVLGER